jgi:hypothetical protein
MQNTKTSSTSLRTDKQEATEAQRSSTELIQKKTVTHKMKRKNTKTLFSPYFKNKTTLVATDNTQSPTLLLYCSLVFYYFWIASLRSQ